MPYVGRFGKREMTEFSQKSTENLLPKVILRIAKWASPKRKFNSLKVDGIMHNWEASFSCGFHKVKNALSCSPPADDVLKFNIDGSTRVN